MMNWRSGPVASFDGNSLQFYPVEAENGHVTLSGQVDSSSDRDAAEQIIRKLSGVVGVTNRINAPDLRASEDCKSQAHKCL